jgi:hypothetical protein
MWVDEGQGRISRVIGEAHELLARATHLPGHQRRGVRVVEGSTRAARPSIATSADSSARLTVWVEWVPGEGDVVQALYEEQGRPASLTMVSGGCSDVFRPTAAISSEGVPWVFYGSSNPKRVGVWANTLLEGRWSEPHQVSTTEHPSFNQEVLARSDGSLELCWQGRHSGRFAVFTRRHAEGAWGPTEMVSEGVEANVWDPSIAGSPTGRPPSPGRSTAKGPTPSSYVGGTRTACSGSRRPSPQAATTPCTPAWRSPRTPSCGVRST